MEVVPGLRVVRGPDWKWGDQDGGEGHVGTVVEVHSSADPPVDSDLSASTSSGEKTSPRTVTVQWDCGNRCRYRCGIEEKYDLRVFDGGPTGLSHANVTCDGCCKDGAVAGARWKCAKCYDYDLCTPCYMSDEHSLDHEFMRYDTLSLRTRVLTRRGAAKQEAKGIFPGAEVVRGFDWKWGDQDGGHSMTGKVLSIEDWGEEDGETCRSGVEVEWTAHKERNQYRLGSKGKVDLKCKVPSSRGFYYPEHMPLLGGPHVPPSPWQFASSDYVRVELDMEIFRMMQEGHGGWSVLMSGVRGKLGVVHSILDTGNLSVSYGEKKWTINPNAVVKVDVPHYTSGDVVRIMDDMAEVMKLQQECGGWNEDMANTTGQLGVVKGSLSSGGVIVKVKGRVWQYHPFCIKPSPDEKPPDSPGIELLGLDESIMIQMKMLSLLEEESSEALLYAALLGNTSVITDYLQKYPNEVNAKFEGKAAIHCAAIVGKIPVMKVLIEFSANIELKDDVGQRPLHHCAMRNQAEAAQFLLDSGVDANAKTSREDTALTIAAAKGNSSVLEVLTKHPTIDLAVQDSDGDTALHCAVYARKRQSVSILLGAGADPTLINFKLFTALHLATNIGYMPVVERIVEHFPPQMNLKNDEGCTPLHIAAQCGHQDLVYFLVKQESCDIDARTHMEHTPLHVAILKGFSRIVECLVGYGASLNVGDCDGDTPLHLVLDRDQMEAPSSETPEINKVGEKIGQQAGVNARAVVACFLVQEGADVFIKNEAGLTPLEGDCPADVAILVQGFAEENGSKGCYHRSLCEPLPIPSQSSESKKDEPQELASETGSSQSTASDGSFVVIPPPSTRPADDTPHVLASTGGDEIDAGATCVESQPPQLCFLCDTAITVRLEPCGHAPLCEHCAGRAKKCPECKVPVQSLKKTN